MNKTLANVISPASAFSLPSILIRTQTSEGNRYIGGGGRWGWGEEGRKRDVQDCGMIHI